MAFWGIEVKPGKPCIHRCDERGRLHVSQATLGSGTSTQKTILQCKVGNKKPIYLCSLLPERLETCVLNLEFEENDEVTFSIVGQQSVHVSGFFYGDNEDQDNLGDDYEYGSDPYYEEDIMGTDSEDEDDSMDYDSEDEDESDDYIGDDHRTYPSSARNSGVRIEEIVDDEKLANENVMPKQAKRQKIQSGTSGDNESPNCQVVKAGTGAPVFESEDEDGFPVQSVRGKKPDTSRSKARLEEISNQKVEEKQKSNEIVVAHGKILKGKIDANDKDGEATREPRDSSVLPDTTTIIEQEVKQKKNKKRKAAEKTESGLKNEKPNPSGTEESLVAATGNDPKPSSEKKKEKKKKKKENKGQECMPTPNAEGKLTDKKALALEKQEKEEVKSLQVRTFPNGLVIEELAMGKPDGKRASPGKKVSVHYIGKLKKNGKIFDSNIGRAPFKFRLGIGQVIKGWDVGVSGMRIGDKRRLTIPPAMGYGAKGVGQIPPNSWLVFDVELVDVN